MNLGWTRTEGEDHFPLCQGHSLTWDDRPDYALQPGYGNSVSELVEKRLESVRRELPDHVLHRITIAPVQSGPGEPENASWDGIIRGWCLQFRQLNDGPIYTTLAIPHEYIDRNAWSAIDQSREMARNMGVDYKQGTLPRSIAIFVDHDLTDPRGIKLGVALAYAITMGTDLNFNNHKTTERIWRMSKQHDVEDPLDQPFPSKTSSKRTNEMLLQAQRRSATHIDIEKWLGVVEEEKQMPKTPSRRRWQWMRFVAVAMLLHVGLQVLITSVGHNCDASKLVTLFLKGTVFTAILAVLNATLAEALWIILANARGQIHPFAKKVRMFLATLTWTKFYIYCGIAVPLLILLFGITYFVNWGWCLIIASPHL